MQRLVLQFKSPILQKVNGYSSGSGAIFPLEIVSVVDYENKALWVRPPLRIFEKKGVVYLGYSFGMIFVHKSNLLKKEIKNSP